MPGPESRNWKQEPLVWLIIAIPASAIVMGLIMLALAIQSWSGLVVDDYYQQGKQINRVLARDKRAWELGLEANLELSADGVIVLRFDADGPAPPGEDIELSLVHATRPGLDRSELVHRLHDRLLAASTPPSGEGRWNVYLQTAEWRLTGSWHYPQTNRVTLRPNYPPE